MEVGDFGPVPRLTSLLARRKPLAEPAVQLACLDAVPLARGDFDERVRETVYPDGLRTDRVRVFQINLGKLCNMTCRHCHVDAGPDRVDEVMSAETIADCLAALDRTNAEVVDLTGGAPELNPHFRTVVTEARRRGKHVIDRCNLSVLLLPRHTGLAAWLAEQEVEIVASLPHPRRSNTDAQRGEGAFERSIAALKLLNQVGYGTADPRKILTLMHNPAGAFLPGAQRSMEADWKATLLRDHGVTFDRLIALNNMPMARFLEWLEETGNTTAYLEKLANAYNPTTVPGLMCRDTLSIGWDGKIYDCDFNQMLDLPAAVDRPHVRDYDPARFDGRPVVVRRHCFGCTAGAGSSCGGATT